MKLTKETLTRLNQELANQELERVRGGSNSFAACGTFGCYGTALSLGC
jgi:natural product precursor